MIRFEPPPKPEGFAERVERRGSAWLRDHPNEKRPRNYWSEFLPALADGFRQLCAYSAIYEPVGTVDHFVSFDEDPTRAYDWSNFRFASGWVNSCKGAVRSTDILDPFEVEDGWFEVLLPSLQLVVSESIPGHLRERAQFVLARLRLGDGEHVIRQRRSWYGMYQAGQLNLDGLREKAPLIARAVERSRAIAKETPSS